MLVGRVAVVTDSAADLPPDVARAAGVVVVPLHVSFGSETFRAGEELSSEAFWARMVAPDAPFPTTAAASPGEFRDAFTNCLAAGAEAIVAVDVGGKLSATVQSARLAAELLPGREIHVIDSESASMGVGLLALLAAELAERGVAAAEIAATLERRKGDLDIYFALDTLEYLRRGGRISGPRATLGTLLSVKPILRVQNGVVEPADRVRTRTRARARLIELLTSRPAESVAIMHSLAADVDAFRDELIAALPGGLEPGHATTAIIGPSVGPHVGPGCLAAVVLARS